jgi:hypothetical protein
VKYPNEHFLYQYPNEHFLYQYPNEHFLYQYPNEPFQYHIGRLVIFHNICFWKRIIIVLNLETYVDNSVVVFEYIIDTKEVACIEY